jgi:hypothetical protein
VTKWVGPLMSAGRSMRRKKGVYWESAFAELEQGLVHEEGGRRAPRSAGLYL